MGSGCLRLSLQEPDVPLGILSTSRDSIRPSLSALEALGLVVVPVEPTEAMLDAADVDWDCRVVDVYAAMIAAAPLTTARGG